MLPRNRPDTRHLDRVPEHPIKSVRYGVLGSL